MSSWCPKICAKEHRIPLKQPGIVLCGILLPLAADPSQAREWSLEPSISLRTEYNDNIQLTPGPHPTVWGMILSTDAKFSGATETMQATGGLNLSFNRYFDQPQLNINNYDLSLRSSYKPERDVFGLDIDAIRDSTLVSELATTGVVLAYSPRNLSTVNPSWSHKLTEATTINARYGYTGVKYGDTSGTGLIDYQDQSASLGVQSNLDEGKVVGVTVSYDRYETSPQQVRANTYGIQGAYEHAFSETLRAALAVGWRWTQSTISSQTLICDGPIIAGICSGTITETTAIQMQNTNGLTLKATLEQRGETDTVSGQLSQEIYPSGSGSLVQTRRVGITWLRQWSPRLGSSVAAAAYQVQYIGGVVTNSNSRYYAVDARLSWRLDEQWGVDAGYSYARQKYDTAPVSANANVLYITIGYAWPRLSAAQ
jgi:hypothetical protein